MLKFSRDSLLWLEKWLFSLRYNFAEAACFFFVILSQCTVAFLGVRGAAKICIAIDATERKRSIDTNLLAKRNAASTHESHHQHKLSNLPPYFLFLGRF